MSPVNSEMNKSFLSGDSPMGKRRRKKVTIIRKKKHRDGSIDVTKHHAYDISVKQAIENV